MATVEIIEGDNLETLRALSTDSIDAVVGDPPYGVNLNPDTCGWDTWPPLECWQELARVTKPDGLMAFTIAPHVAHERVPDTIAAGWSVLEVGFWVYGSGRPVRVDRLKRCYDLVYFMGLKSRSLFTEQARGAYKANTITGRRGEIVASRARGGLGKQFHSCGPGKYICGQKDYHPANVACTTQDYTLGDYRLIFAVKRLLPIGRANKTHPTEKPNDLMGQIVKLVSRPGDVVLDPWMGSGTTGVACLALQRNFIGIETVPEYVEMARLKLKAVQIQLFVR